MVDPSRVTIFNRSISELQEFLLFCIVVAGKKAIIQAEKLDRFLSNNNKSLSPFDIIRQYILKGILLDKMKEVGLGQYSKLEPAFRQVINLNVRTCKLEDLELIFGIGPKTSRFFLLHSRPDQKLAVLDTHILNWMRSELKISAPRSTPPKKVYAKLEKAYLDYCEDNKFDPATLDLQIWNKYSSKKT